MSTSADNSQKFWNKFKYSTKSLQSSFAGLSLRSESDGDSPTSTVVHKTLVKFYKNQEPFTGFPGWLGEKEDLPNEDKILKKQAEGKPVSSSHNSLGADIGNSWSSVRKPSWERGNGHASHREPSHKELNGETFSPTSGSERQTHTSAGMSFQRIYNKEPSPGSISHANHRAPGSFHMRPVAQSTAGSDMAPQQTEAGPTRSNTTSSSSLMRDRLKRNNTKNSFNF